jgi:hypothetical protein
MEDFIFNGIFSNNPASRAIANLSLYSPTGVYAGQDKFPFEQPSTGPLSNDYSKNLLNNLSDSLG